MDKVQLASWLRRDSIEVYFLLQSMLKKYEGEPEHSMLMEDGAKFFAERFGINPNEVMPVLVVGSVNFQTGESSFPEPNVATITGAQLQACIPDLISIGLIEAKHDPSPARIEQQEASPATLAYLDFKELWDTGNYTNKLALGKQLALKYYPDIEGDKNEIEKRGRIIVDRWRKETQ